MKSGRQVYHIKRFIGRERYRPTKSPNVRPALTTAAKIVVGQESGMSDFFRRYGRPTVKLPSVMLEATLSGDILQFLHYFGCYFNNYFITMQIKSTKTNIEARYEGNTSFFETARVF